MTTAFLHTTKVPVQGDNPHWRSTMAKKQLSKDVSISWKFGALRGIRYGDTAPSVQSVLEKWSERVAANANRMSGTTGYKTSSRAGRRNPQGRWRTTVITANYAAMRDNAKNNTLTKALFQTTGTSFTP
jgi:hypothetical protein